MNNERERKPYERAAEQFAGLLTNDRLDRPYGQQRQGDSSAKDCHDVELRAKSAAGEHGFGGGQQHSAEHSDQRGRPVRDPGQQVVEESVEEGLGERAHQTCSPDTGEHASDRVRQRSDRALDRSEDPGKASGATRVLCAGDIARPRVELNGISRWEGSVDPMTGLEQEVHEGRSGPDQKGGNAGGEHRLSAGVRILIVVRVASERPGRGAEHQADERRGECPPPEAIGQLLDRGLARQGRGARGHRDDAGKQQSGRHNGHRPTFQDGGFLGQGLRRAVRVCSAACVEKTHVPHYRVTYRTRHEADASGAVGISARRPAMLGEMSRVLHVTVLEFVITVVVVIAVITATGLIAARRGRTGLRQRLQALASRLGADSPQKDANDFEEVLIVLEHATDRAAEAVAEASSEAIRLRRALDTLPQAVLVTDERGETVFRNSKAVALIGSRQGDALAAQAVEELLAATAPGAHEERVLELYGPPRRTLVVPRKASTTASAPSV